MFIFICTMISIEEEEEGEEIIKVKPDSVIVTIQLSPFTSRAHTN